MPNRDLKECNRRSASLKLISDAAERLWYRIITSVDDFGRMEADPEVVFQTCFQRVPKGWNAHKVSRCLHELATLRAEHQDPLILLYQVNLKSYLQIISAHTYIYKRAKESKYPNPTVGTPYLLSTQEIRNEGGCAQVCADSLDSRVPNPDIPNPDFKVVPEDDGTTSRFQEFWQAYPARNGKKLERAATEALFAKLSIQDQALAVKAARNYAEALKAQGISAKDPKRFFKDDYWREWITAARPEPVKMPAMTIPKAYITSPSVIPRGDPMPENFRDLIDKLGKGVPTA